MHVTLTRTRVRLVALFAGAFVMISAPASSHHSFSMYDQSTTRTMSGKVIQFISAANHAQLLLQVLDAHGTPEMNTGMPVQWGVEMASARQMSRHGVTPDSIPQGTVLTVRVYPMRPAFVHSREGRNFGALAGVLITCGHTMPKGGCTKETGHVFPVASVDFGADAP